jgi:putative salt-induced outer membrane protein YdiY
MKRTLLPIGFSVAAMAASTLSVMLPSASAADAPPPPSPSTNKWESVIAAGLTLTRGNSETLLGVLTVNAKRKTDIDEVLLGAAGTYGESTVERDGRDETDKTAGSISAFGQYNRSLTDLWYAGLRTDFLHDAISEVKYRVTISPLIGYYAIKQPKTTLKFEAGPSGVFEKQGDDENQYAALRIGERFEHKFTDKARVWQSADFMPQVDRFHNYLLTVEVGAEAALTQNLSLRAVAQDNYDNVPADDRKKNDLKLITALAYKF